MNETADILEEDVFFDSDVQNTSWLARRHWAICALEKHKAGPSDDQGHRAKDILKDLQLEKFVKYLSFMMDATKVPSTLSKTFQSAELCITDILTGLETTVALLEQFRQEKGPQYKKFKEGYCEETGILQVEPLSYFKVFDSTKEMPQEHSHLATYGNHEVKSLVEHFRSNYLTEQEETSIIVQWPALCTRPVRQKAITPNHVFSNLLAST